MASPLRLMWVKERDHRKLKRIAGAEACSMHDLVSDLLKKPKKTLKKGDFFEG